MKLMADHRLIARYYQRLYRKGSKKNNRIFFFKALINPPPLIEKIIKRHVVIFMDRFSWLLVFWVEFWGKQGTKQKNSTQKANNHENLSINMRVEKFSRWKIFKNFFCSKWAKKPKKPTCLFIFFYPLRVGGSTP